MCSHKSLDTHFGNNHSTMECSALTDRPSRKQFIECCELEKRVCHMRLAGWLAGSVVLVACWCGETPLTVVRICLWSVTQSHRAETRLQGGVRPAKQTCFKATKNRKRNTRKEAPEMCSRWEAKWQKGRKTQGKETHYLWSEHHGQDRSLAVGQGRS